MLWHFESHTQTKVEIKGMHIPLSCFKFGLDQFLQNFKYKQTSVTDYWLIFFQEKFSDIYQSGEGLMVPHERCVRRKKDQTWIQFQLTEEEKCIV